MLGSIVYGLQINAQSSENRFPDEGQSAAARAKCWPGGSNKLYEQIQAMGHGRLDMCSTMAPYANGRIHIRHALNKILKDIIVSLRPWPASRHHMCLVGITMGCR